MLGAKYRPQRKRIYAQCVACLLSFLQTGKFTFLFSSNVLFTFIHTRRFYALPFPSVVVLPHTGVYDCRAFGEKIHYVEGTGPL